MRAIGFQRLGQKPSLHTLPGWLLRFAGMQLPLGGSGARNICARGAGGLSVASWTTQFIILFRLDRIVSCADDR
uniref:Uncharacterized protein n=1 Tax=Arundo donax TaxID=35708 RepID=A0A0A9GEV9_ARUDO